MPEKTKNWIPIARSSISYIPALENSSYQFEKWSPIELNKQMFTSRVKSREITNCSNRLNTTTGSVVSNYNFSETKRNIFARKDSRSFSTQIIENNNF